MPDTAKTIEELANRWMQAWIDKDQRILEETLAPDFALVMSSNPLQKLDRASWLATATSRYTCTWFRYRDVQIRELGSVVVMSSVAEFTAQVDGISRSGPLFLTDVWRRSGEGRWQVCARYSSLPEPAQGSSQAVQTLAS